MHMKIFGIGLSKTGTMSLTAALGALGFRVLHAGHRFVDEPPEGLTALDGATDELATEYARLDQKFPGARFILTTRALEPWLKSCQHQFRAPVDPATRGGRIILDLYGTTQFDRDRFAAGYQRHHEAVHAYFARRERDLLVMDVAAGDGYEKLCPFLGVPVPGSPFPRENVSRSADRFWRRVRRSLGGGRRR
jgi:hypothetical protein